MVNLKKNTKNHYAPKRWSLDKVSNKIKGLLNKIWNSEKGSKEWYLYQFKRELEQIKKHVIFLNQIIEFYEKSDQTNNKRKGK
jgi:hypothetical protein